MAREKDTTKADHTQHLQSDVKSDAASRVTARSPVQTLLSSDYTKAVFPLAWLYQVIKDSRAYSDDSAVANGWYDVRVGPSWHVWAPRAVVWAIVLLGVLGGARRDRFLNFGQSVVVAFCLVQPVVRHYAEASVPVPV
ncbi:hypothetical protein JCM11491_001742 [Sporobolomyces phaffii]